MPDDTASQARRVVAIHQKLGPARVEIRQQVGFTGLGDGIVHDVAHERFREHHLSLGVPVDGVDAAQLVVNLLFRIFALVTTGPRTHHEPRRIGNALDDARPACLRRESADDRQGAGQLAHLRLGDAVLDVIHVRAALFVPESFQTASGPLVQSLGPALAGALFQPAGHLREVTQTASENGREHSAGVLIGHARPVHQVPLDHVLQRSVKARHLLV